MRLYQKVTSAETATPKPVEEPAKTRKRLSLSLVAILMAVACALYLWKGYPSHDKSLTIYDRLSLPEKPTEEVHEERVEPPNDQMEESTPQIPDPAFEDMSSPDVLFSEKAEGPFSIDPVPPLESGSVPEIETPELTLKINVKEMTWVRIFVDDQGPKEYMSRGSNLYFLHFRDQIFLFDTLTSSLNGIHPRSRGPNAGRTHGSKK